MSGSTSTDGAQPDVGEQPGAEGPPLARTLLDRAAHRRQDADWLAEAWQRGRVLVIDIANGGRAPVREAGGGAELVLLDPAHAPDGERMFLGVDPDGTPVFMIDAALPELPGTRPATLRDIGHLLGARDAGVFTAAAALGNWHATHLYSPRSGQPTRTIEGGWSRVDDAGGQMWPRTDPAMIVLVHDGVPGPEGRCLLGHNAAWPQVGEVRRFSCLAGFVEPGESAEAAVVREVAEEVGVRLSSLHYEGSQSWPYPGSLMLGFTAVADRAQQFVLDPTEIDEARWFTRAEVTAMIAGEYADPDTGVRMGLPMRSSIAFFLVERWLAGPGD
ncbi:NAD+ diphosphatase [Krasilnikovia cinnamomea]|uniref:NAD(+) diphosphatase n=1 Tax=Krasilnikovia cinnamomea TaxID=349313 RepID=A0A4Q7ZI50_9ACTN|nr:NAD(+) diphosphatase [Krasilnikovia cinnamomea]RZU50101.1 NAD+ diphosphatase [Krasilnikovia cinnamomea]